MPNNKEQYTSLGALFTASREEARISIDKAAEILRVPSQTLLALEAGEYEKLPPDAFLRGIISKYADFLKLDKLECIAKYENDISFSASIMRSGSADILPKNRFSSKPIWWALGAKELAYAAAVAGFMYLVWQFIGFLQPPSIQIDSPPDRFTVTSTNHLVISGTVRGTRRLTINTERVSSDNQGKFRNIVELKEGENIIEVLAEDRHNRTARETFRVLYQPPQRGIDENIE
jgi:DNA-binding XRE family transcriptional regulator